MNRAGTHVIANLVVLLAYFVAAKLGLSLATINQSTTIVWPATGIALAAALLLGKRVWPAIWLAAFAVNYHVSNHALASAGIATGNFLEATVGAALVNQFANGRRVFDRAGDIFRFVLYAGFVGTAISSTIGVTMLELSGQATWERYGPIWMIWWLGDMISTITVAPVLITWLGQPLPRRMPRGEALAMLAVAIVTALIVIGPLAPPRVPIGYFSILPLLWAAFRFHQHGATAGFLVTGIIATWGVLVGHGPFALADRQLGLFYLETYLGTISITSLVLSAIVAERQAARREAEAANQAKDNFLAVLSHELRTPLTPALLTASLLEQTPDLPPQVQEDLKTIRRNIELEARLIDDLLDLTRIARGKLRLNLETTDLHGAIKGAVQICANGNSNVSVDLAASTPMVRGDAARLQQVFWNLLSNAQKFTPKEGSIAVRSTNPHPGRIRIDVTDTGIGIDPALMPKLFHAFEQGNGVAARKFGGLGLGLAISNSLIAAHGGTLSASSEGAGKARRSLSNYPARSSAKRKPTDSYPWAL